MRVVGLLHLLVLAARAAATAELGSAADSHARPLVLATGLLRNAVAIHVSDAALTVPVPCKTDDHVGTRSGRGAHGGGGGGGGGKSAGRSISWWWTGMHLNATSPEVEAMLSFCREHRDIVSTLIMRCGVLTCCRAGTGDCGTAIGHVGVGCTNNHGRGGTIAGVLSDGCKAAIPKLVAMGIRPEIWLGEDDSITSARTLFNSSSQIADALLHIADQNPGLAGFNLDLESKQGTPTDKRDFIAFLRSVTAALNSSNSLALRFSADVGCVAPGEGGGPLASDCKALASSGVARLMDMATCECDPSPQLEL
jgi:hypothetical protein